MSDSSTGDVHKMADIRLSLDHSRLFESGFPTLKMLLNFKDIRIVIMEHNIQHDRQFHGLVISSKNMVLRVIGINEHPAELEEKQMLLLRLWYWNGTTPVDSIIRKSNRNKQSENTGNSSKCKMDNLHPKIIKCS